MCAAAAATTRTASILTTCERWWKIACNMLDAAGQRLYAAPSHPIPSTSPTPIQALAPTARWQLWHQLQLQKYTQASLLWFLVFLFIFYIFNMGSLMSCGLNTKNIPIRMLGNLVPSANQEYAVTKKIIEYITPY